VAYATIWNYLHLDHAGIALANTVVLVSSGISITYTHRYLILVILARVKEGFIITLLIRNVYLFWPRYV
jgi:heme/copper-type cytochrome/quinol oxidase subunit 3